MSTFRKQLAKYCQGLIVERKGVSYESLSSSVLLINLTRTYLIEQAVLEPMTMKKQQQPQRLIKEISLNCWLRL